MDPSKRTTTSDDDFEIVDAPDVGSPMAGTNAPAGKLLDASDIPRNGTTTEKVKIEDFKEDEFDQLVRVMQAHIDQYAPFSKPLFHANLAAAQPAQRTLFQVFLDNLPEPVRAIYNCRTCRHFINSFGDLCLVDETDGSLKPLLWPVDAANAPVEFHAAIKAIRALFVNAEISSDYQLTNSEKLALGREKTTTNTSWRHFHFTLTGARVVTDTSGVLDLGTATSMLTRLLDDNDVKSVNTAHHLLHEKLPYSTSHTPAIDWLQKRVLDFDQRGEGVGRRNLIKHYARDAWTGCLSSLRNGIIGQLLTLVREGKPYSDIHDQWSALANPLAYLRPTAEPSIGNIEVAEKKLEELGFTNEDLERYWLATDELPEAAILWKDTALWCTSNNGGGGGGGVFDDLKKKVQGRSGTSQASGSTMQKFDNAPPTTISFRNFVRRVVPNMDILEIKLNAWERFSFLTRGAPGRKSPFLFDSKNPENNMSCYYWGGDEAVSGANLRAGWNRVTGIITFPHMWDYLSPKEAVEWDESAEEPQGEKWIHARHGVRFMFCLEGVKETPPRELCLFPTMLKNTFHAVRRTMEAFSRDGKMQWPHQESDGKAQVGGLPADKNKWKERHVMVTTKAGVVTEYTIFLFD